MCIRDSPGITSRPLALPSLRIFPAFSPLGLPDTPACTRPVSYTHLDVYKRQGQVQLIDATQWFKPLRKNLGKKNCELSPEDIERINRTFLDFKETPESKLFPNATFGYWKVTVERPLRLHSQLTLRAIATPVSYTHLDVYKRQDEGRSRQATPLHGR